MSSKALFEAAVAALLVASTEAKIFVTPDETGLGTTVLLYNKDTTNPYPAVTEATQPDLKWTITNYSLIDEDSGYEFLEIESELEMMILPDDEVTFHIEFISN